MMIGRDVWRLLSSNGDSGRNSDPPGMGYAKKKKKLMNEYCVNIGEKRIPYPLQWAS